MKSDLCMVVPSYWARRSDIGWMPGDAVYDHPIPLDHEGTLLRLLKSLEILETRDFTVIVLAIPTSEEIAEEVEKRVKGIIDEATEEVDVPIHHFGFSHLYKVHQMLEEEGREDLKNLLQWRGYSNIRNLCTFVPHVLGSEAAILIDDDEVFEDPKFIDKATEYIGRQYSNIPVYGVAGYYLQENGEVRLNKPHEPWMDAWDQLDRMNEAFDQFIVSPPRLKETPFVFGGNIVIHRDLFMKVPFDPLVPRGEDIDFLINSKMFGFRFFIDNALAIKHLPPPKSHPVWRRLREDVFRFLFEREKIKKQRDIEGMVRVGPEDFDPYPGDFLKGDLEQKVEKASHILAAMYKESGDKQGAHEALQTIVLMRKALSVSRDPFNDLIVLQKRWEDLMRLTNHAAFRENASELFANWQ